MKNMIYTTIKYGPFLVAIILVSLFLMGFNLANENGVIENLQIIMLVLAFIMYLIRITDIRAGKCEPCRDAWLVWALFFSVLPYFGVGRELSYGGVFGLSESIEDMIKAVMIIIGLLFWIIAAWLWLFRIENRFQKLRALLTSSAMLWLVAFIILFVIGERFEKGQLGFPKSQTLEEIAEFVAFSFILRAAWHVGKTPV